VGAETVEANAVMRSIVRRDTGEGYEEFLKGPAEATGIETPTREALAKLDPEPVEEGVEQGLGSNKSAPGKGAREPMHPGAS
jgi:hypothetical protein